MFRILIMLLIVLGAMIVPFAFFFLHVMGIVGRAFFAVVAADDGRLKGAALKKAFKVVRDNGGLDISVRQPRDKR